MTESTYSENTYVAESYIFEKTDDVRAKGLLQRHQREKQQESCFSMNTFVSACTQNTKRKND